MSSLYIVEGWRPLILTVPLVVADVVALVVALVVTDVVALVVP